MSTRNRGSTLQERDRNTLKEFLACSVPKQYFDLDARGNMKLDFHYCYEEIYDYSDALLRGEEIDLGCNFVGVPATAVNKDFTGILEVVGRRNPVLEDFCAKLSAAVAVIERVAR